MEKKLLLEKVSVKNGTEKLTIYSLTKKGISEAQNIFIKYFHNALAECEYLNNMYRAIKGDDNIEPMHCVEYLINRYNKANVNKKQAALLSNIGYSSPYFFSCTHEVTFDRFGHPVSTYQKLYQTQTLHKGEVRSDTSISFHVGTADGATLDMYIEHDTGSQASSILKDKVSQYSSFVFAPLLKESPSFLPYLIFSISYKPEGKENAISDRLEFKTRERYLAQGLSLAASVYLSYNEVYGVSLYELRTFLETAPLSSRDRSSFLPFLDYCIKEIGGDKNAIDIVEKLYGALKYGNDDKEQLYEQRCERYYGNRRDLLFKSMDDIPELKKQFLQGVSVCAVSTHQSAAIRTFLPECCGMSSCLARNFSTTSSPVRVTNLLSLAHFSCGEEDIVLRNVYTLSDGRIIAVENIGDDYGAYVRIQYLLEKGYSPCNIVCLVAPYDLDRIKELFRKHHNKSILSCFFIMSYMYRLEETEGEHDRIYTYDSIILPGVVPANKFI